MKHYLLAGALLAALSATACSGGGGSASPGGAILPPGSTPTAAPVASYSASMIYSGGDAPIGYGTLASSYMRRHPLSASTPLPIMLTAPTAAMGTAFFQFSAGTVDSSATATIVVSPSPSPSVVPSWSSSAPNVTVGPIAQSSPNPYQAWIVSQHPGSGIYTANGIAATIGSPVNQSQSLPVYVYPRIVLACPSVDTTGFTNAVEWVQGVSFVNGVVVAENTRSSSDIYISGPKCYGDFNDPSESGTTLHYPHGGVTFADNVEAFSSFTPSQWTGSVISSPIAAMTVPSVQYPLDNILIKDAAGEVVKIHFASMSSIDKNSGPYQVDGYSIDGF